MTTYANLKILEDYTHEMFMVADKEFRTIINTETGGTLTSVSRPTPGDFYTKTYWGSETDLVDIESPNTQTTATDAELKKVQQVDIKTAISSKKILWQNIANRWAGYPVDDQAVKGAQRIVGLIMKKKVQALVASLVACFSRGLLTTGKDTEVEKAILNKSPTAASTPAEEMDILKIIEGKMRLGDDYGEITGAIMHSGAFAKLNIRNISQFSELFSGQYGTNFVMRTADGIPVYVTDNPALTFTPTGGVPKYRTLLLKPGAATIYENNDFDSNIETSNDKTWIERSLKAEVSFNIGIDAFTWASLTAIHPKIGTTAGTGLLIGLHTDAGVLDNPGSWRRVGVSESRPVLVKNLPGVMVISQ